MTRCVEPRRIEHRLRPVRSCTIDDERPTRPFAGRSPSTTPDGDDDQGETDLEPDAGRRGRRRPRRRDRFGAGAARPGALPFALSAREQFSALDDSPVTGEARVDAATARLGEIADLPTPDHVAVYDDVHRRLQDALADADAH